MRVSFAACAMGVSVDRATNMPTLFNVLEVLPVVGFPFWIPQVTYFCVIRRQDGEGDNVDTELVVRLHGRELHRIPMHFNFSVPGLNGLQAQATVQGIQVEGPGSLEFGMTLPDQAESVFRMTIVAPPQTIQVTGVPEANPPIPTAVATGTAD